MNQYANNPVLQNFANLHNQLLQNPLSKNQTNNAQIRELGMMIIRQTTDITTRDEILTKLIMLYPDDATLYLELAKAFKPINAQRAILWHKIAYQIDPTNADNVIDLFQLYMDIGLSKNVFEMNQNGKLDQFMENERFLGVFARCHFQQLYYKNGVDHLLKLIKIYSTKKCNTKDDKHTKWTNYHDIGYVCCAMGDIERALLYTNKATELALKFDLELKDKMLSYSNSLCYEDFGYPDNEKLFKKYENIHLYYPDNPRFSFKNRSYKNIGQKNVGQKNIGNKSSEKIRIGYVSSDYMYHAVGNFILPILKNHDRSRFEIYLFANQEQSFDLFTNLNHKYICIHRHTDYDAAQLIKSHEIDILFDLNGHTVNNRLGIFALHPAPIQITYLGFPNTTGMKSMHYRITDSVADHPQTTQRYSEQLIRLPKCFLLYQNMNQPAPTTPRKTRDQIILAAVNKENKNSKYALETWAMILKECPTAKLLLKLETFDNNEERMGFYMKQLDVPRNRIILINKLSNEDYNRLFTMFDLLLDTFPYSGTTTTCNSLYNSVPLVSLYDKDHHSHNVSCSLLTGSGLTELVAKSREDYVNIVKDLVNNPSKIDEYKRTIHGKFMKLMEPKPFMESYEDALLTTYKKYFKKDVQASSSAPPMEQNDNITIDMID